MLFAIVFSCPWEVCAQTMNTSDVDQARIKQAALDDIEGWYAGDAERMKRALHPDLAKRIVLIA
jgi:hypothetical protein